MSAWLEIQRATGVERRAVTRDRAKGKCPGCGVEPFVLVRHGEPKQVNDRLTRVGTYCASCRDPVGYAYEEYEGIFGAKEDASVLDGRARVYGTERIRG